VESLAQMDADDALRAPGRVSTERRGEFRVVSLQGEHDVSTVDLVRKGLADAGAGTGEIIVDLVDAVFIDSSVAGALLEAYRRDVPPRMRFVVASGTSPRALFTALGFDGSVPIFERREDALARASAGSDAEPQLDGFP
jgi:anti-sigma B factor antagonist